MDYGFYLGIDVSKLTFDYALIDSTGTVPAQGKAGNRPAAARAWAKEMGALLKWGGNTRLHGALRLLWGTPSERPPYLHKGCHLGGERPAHQAQHGPPAGQE